MTNSSGSSTICFAVNGQPVEPAVENGYARIPGGRKRGDVVTMEMGMEAEMVAADPRVKADEGKRAVQRGPLVYCIEGADNPGLDFDAARLSPATTLSGTFESETLGGVYTLRSSEGLNFIPYYAWDNREPGKMKVWIDYTE